jgi:hypothetical protein
MDNIKLLGQRKGEKKKKRNGQKKGKTEPKVTTAGCSASGDCCGLGGFFDRFPIFVLKKAAIGASQVVCCVWLGTFDLVGWHQSGRVQINGM